MYSLPTSVEIGGVKYGLRNRGDYRTVLDIFSVLEDPDLEKSERIISALIIFYEDFNSIDDVLEKEDLEEWVSQMFQFFEAGRPEGPQRHQMKLIDWEGDEAIVMAAINGVAKTEIRALEYLHWWTFMSYYMSVGESTLSTVVGIRDKITRSKKMEKWERQFRDENPQYFVWKSKTVEDIEAENWVMSVWNKE